MSEAGRDDAPEVPLRALDQLWFQVSGTVCNLRCGHCFISCAPDNHSFWFLTRSQIRAALEQAEDEEWVAVFVLGDPAYYDRFGFDVGQASTFSSPYPAEFTGVAILDGAGFSMLTREIEYPKAFAKL